MCQYQILNEFETTLMNVQDLIGDGIPNNIQIDKVCYKIFGDNFLGTRSADKMPKYIKEEQ